jgi:hypothetical protein
VKDYTLPVRFLRSKEFTDFDPHPGLDDTHEQIGLRELRQADLEMLDINGNVRDEAQYGTQLGQQAEPVTFVGEWEAMAPLDIFKADGRALEMGIDVYETKEERGESVSRRVAAKTARW